MSRKLERRLLIVGGTWNIITAIMTIFGYSAWFQNSGGQALQYTEVNPIEAGVLIKHLSTVIFVFGLCMFVGGIVTIIVARNIQDNKVQNKLLIWVAVWGVLQLLSTDVIGVCLFSIAFAMYLAKNKAVRLSQA